MNSKWTYACDTEITSSVIDSKQQMKLSCLFNTIQDTVMEHMVVLGISVEQTLAKYNCFWMSMRYLISLKRPIHWGETLRSVLTLRPPMGSRIYWDYDFFIGDEKVGEATCLFALVDKDKRKTLNCEGLPEFPSEPTGKDRTLSRVVFPDELKKFAVRKLYYSDVDLNGHVNNARYVDFACDAAQLEKRPKGAFIKEFMIAYVSECFAGDVIDFYRTKDDDSLYIHGVGEDGRDRFDCVITMNTNYGLGGI